GRCQCREPCYRLLLLRGALDLSWFGLVVRCFKSAAAGQAHCCKRDIKSGDAAGVDAWRTGMEQALQDEAHNPYRDPSLPPITRTKMVNKFGERALEGYPWA